MIKTTRIALILTTFCSLPILGVTRMNLLIPYDQFFIPAFNKDMHAQPNFMLEYGFKTLPFDNCGDQVNALQLWECDQDTLGMLEGFPLDSCVEKLLMKIDASDNGTRGHVKILGDLDLDIGFTSSLRFFYHCDWIFGIHLPAYSMQLKNVSICDLTKNVTAQDMRVRECLTNNLAQNVFDLSGGLEIRDWRRSGVGDLTLMVEWFRDFPQARNFLKNARVHWFGGLGFPTGKREDIDLLLAFPFGADGAFTIPFGLSLDLTLGRYFKTGLAINFIHTFGKSRCRRIITEVGQTELIRLATVDAYKDSGLTQRFNLYFEFYKLLQGFSLKLGYQFIKKGEDTVWFSNPQYSNTIANTARYLEESVMHQMLIWGRYDFKKHMPEDSRVVPEFGVFARIPFKGKNAVLFRTAGISLALDF